MKNSKHDTKQTNYRSWKSGKKWLYASGVLATLVVGTGITPKILNYVHEGLGDTVAHAMSNTASVLLRGVVLPTDFYASVSDFTVPATVVKDFPNNATISSTGGINPYWSGSTFVIPAAPAANAIANFNQPLDPSKDFSISGSVTVPDGRIPAAGFYISDIPSSEIIDKLGTGVGNWPGSSGSLKDESQAYKGHYMLFSGFHNDGGWIATLSSGTAYSRITAGGSAFGASEYMDDDYVGLYAGWENVVVDVSINYAASTGIVSVTYKHNSSTTDWGVGAYDSKTKSATIQYRIPKDKPVYLGIVGNGNKNDSKYTSRSVVTGITGTYLTTNRTVRFIDEAGNKLALDSKILMPRGGRLGIGNEDDEAPYYFDKPGMPSGYTYLSSLNPTAYVGESTFSLGAVVYQRDTQQWTVKHINQLTGKNIGTDEWTAKTNETINQTTNALSGYYIVDKDAVVGSDVSNPATSSDGSKVTWTAQVDDTSNGTSTTDSTPQEANLYALPSVQERILTIHMPDGSQKTETQRTTTDTDFPELGGQYAIPGYRAVIDDVPVTDAEVNLGIPSEATDKTPNLKATTDSVPQRHTITYQAEIQTANIVYKDATTGTILREEGIQGVGGTLLPYDTAYTVEYYRQQGYILKSTNFTDNAEKFDFDSSVDQEYLIEFVHDSQKKSESKTVHHDVKYTVRGGQGQAPPDYRLTETAQYEYFEDQMTGDKITTNFANYAVNGDITLDPSKPRYLSGAPGGQTGYSRVESDGTITFDSPEVPSLSGYLPTVTENTSVHYNNVHPTAGHTLTSTVVYELDATINVTIPTSTIFYNKTDDVTIKSPIYTIKNNSGVPMKVSLAGFTPNAANPAMPADFALSLNPTGKKVTTASAKLVENGLPQTSSNQLMTLANCFNQYDEVDPAVDKGVASDNIATFTFGGSATTTDMRKLGYILNLKFDSTPF
ncbi:mucin-binding protein [Pseudolactococcus reticulitermitis]|uniref:Mucin binding domain-containing protein n=1 Tax=Pseudolactococcus reticulitermitis TaxID=2025039 RepID=A0A224WVT1_9LACT|nr:KxYKxGKxW signal peptide domain-containing protein [Lactococcus reticulitermitis]GAX46499.1 hypothetical protein RsY01_78 [Lactococcus reticulitermitis]